MLKLENAQALQRKVSINVPDKEAEHTIFTLPFEGIELTKDQLDAYLGKGTFASWFNHRKDGIWEPMPWVARLPKAEIALDDEFETAGVEIVVSGNKELVFEGTEADEDDKGNEIEATPGGRITGIRLTPKLGGVTLLAFHLQVRPGLGKENLELQRHQYRHVTVTLGDLTAIERKEKTKQGDLPFHPPGAEGDKAAEPAVNGDDTKDFAAGAEREVEEHKRRGSVINGR